jgi:hypothetical protein
MLLWKVVGLNRIYVTIFGRMNQALYNRSFILRLCKVYWGDPDVDGRIILRWIFRKWEGLWGLDGAGSG